MKPLVFSVLLFQSTQAEEARKPEGLWFTDATSQFVFFAVLEGLYRDGISTETVELIVPRKDKNSEPTMENFIYTCPLCHPAYEAFRIYLCRKPFYGQKAGSVDTFGAGLPGDMIRNLNSTEGKKKRGVIRQLIAKWVQTRLGSMNLPEKERQDWQARIKKLSDRGTEAMKRFKTGSNGDYYKNHYQDWDECAICEGSLEGCKLPVGDYRSR